MVIVFYYISVVRSINFNWLFDLIFFHLNQKIIIIFFFILLMLNVQWHQWVVIVEDSLFHEVIFSIDGKIFMLSPNPNVNVCKKIDLRISYKYVKNQLHIIPDVCICVYKLWFIIYFFFSQNFYDSYCYCEISIPFRV